MSLAHDVAGHEVETATAESGLAHAYAQLHAAETAVALVRAECDRLRKELVGIHVVIILHVCFIDPMVF